MAYDFSKLKANIKETEEWLSRELSGVRTGRATPTLLDGVKPEAYGARTPLRELASVSVEDARTLRVIPWDMTILKAIEKGITDANLGIGVSIDDQGLRVTFPELTSERRAQLSKIAGDKTEQAKVTLRAHRTEALHALEAASKEGGMGKDEIMRLKTEAQKLIDAGNDALAKVLEKKEAEIAQ
ncbi:MAG: ribosome recycling factor [Parcubacteria group bacterium Gr01-1014_49]|nr:MAG: ribosome recycling factor [Parcubacteria group bacterium Gr01-1014_49]